MAVESSRILSNTHHSVDGKVDPFTSLHRYSSDAQVQESNLSPESITVREIFKAPCLQSLRNLESLVNTLNKDNYEEICDYLYSLSVDSMEKRSKSHQALKKISFTQKSNSSLQMLSAASDLMQKVSLWQKSALFCPQIHDDRGDMDKSKVASQLEKLHNQINDTDTNYQEDRRKCAVTLQSEVLERKLEDDILDNVHITAQSKLSQIAPHENLIEQVW